MSRLEKCKELHRDMLLEYLSQEAVRNTFLIGDIMNYGFDNEIQQVWADIEGRDEGMNCVAVYLWFCNNLLVYSHREELQEASLKHVLELKVPQQIMAKRKHLQQMQPMLEGYEIKSKELLACERLDLAEVEARELWAYKYGTLDDVDCIYGFLQSGELAPLYRSREMIEKRIETGEGIHIFIEDEGRIVAHVNSAASTPYSTMIGGLFTEETFRNQGMGRFLLEKICREIRKSEKVPCLISPKVDREENLFFQLGFQEVEEFTTLELS